MGKFKTIHSGETLTRSSFRDECNINSIMAKAVKGLNVPINSKSPLFGDVSNMGTYHEMNLRLQEIQNEFLHTVPAEVRLKFGNDSGRFADWLQKPENKDEAIRLGLIEDAGRVAQMRAEAIADEQLAVEKAKAKKAPKEPVKAV